MLLPRQKMYKLNNHLDVFDSFPASQSVTSDDGGRVDLLLDELVGVAQQLGGDDDDGRRAVTDFLILKLSEFDQDLKVCIIK